MRKKMTLFVAAVMALLTTVSPALADPPATAPGQGLHTAHESIPEGVPGHDYAPYPEE